MLKVELGASGTLAALLAGMHGLSLALLWIMPLSLWGAVFASAVILASFAHTVRRDALRTRPQSIVALEFGKDASCEMGTLAGGSLKATVLGTSFVAPYLTVLNFRVEGDRLARHVVILPDAIDTETFRQLRVLLRWKFRDR